MTMNEVVAIKVVIQDTLHCGGCRLIEGILPQYLKQSEGLGMLATDHMYEQHQDAYADALEHVAGLDRSNLSAWVIANIR